MRNSSDPSHRTLEKKFNHHIKSLVKKPPQTFGKESIFHKLIDLGDNKKEEPYSSSLKRNIKVEHMRIINEIPLVNKPNEINKISNPKNLLADFHGPKERNVADKSLKDYQTSFLYSESIKASLPEKGDNFSSLKSKGDEGKMPNAGHANSFSKRVNAKCKHVHMTESNNTDSRVTGGGTPPNQDYVNPNPKLKLSEKHTLNTALTKKNSKDLNPSRKVSFKIKTPLHRRPMLASNKVATLTQKFNELIKVNEDITQESKITIINDNIKNYKIKNRHCNVSSPSSTLPSNVNGKIKTYNKISVKRRTSLKSRSSSNASIDKVLPESPIAHRKLTRIKSDLPKKKISIRKKTHDLNKKVESPYSTKSNSIIDKDKNDTDTSETLELRKPKYSVKRKPSFKTSPVRHSVNVRAAIQKFEHTKPELSIEDTKIISLDIQQIVQHPSSNDELNTNKDLMPVQKPKIPEKKINLSKTKNVVMRDGKQKFKSIKSISLDIPTIDPDITFNESLPKEIVLDQIVKTESEIKTKKEFIYDKVKFSQGILNKPKLQLSNATDILIDSSSTSTLVEIMEDIEMKFIDDVDKEIALEKETNSTNSNDDKLDSLTEDEKLYQEVSARIKPNDSFLWRSNSKLDLIPTKEYEIAVDLITEEDDDLYDVVGPSTAILKCESEKEITTPLEESIPSFEVLLKKADDLLDNKKREIAEDLKKEKISITVQDFCNEAFNLNIRSDEEIVEAVNEVAIHDTENIIKHEYQQNVDEGYEPLEPYRNDLTDSQKSLAEVSNKSHNKSNCPLPEVPQEKEQFSYKYLFAESILTDDDNSSSHSYEYCASKRNEQQFYNNDSDDGYEICTAPKANAKTKTDESLVHAISPKINISSKDAYSPVKSNSPTSSMGYEKISSIYESIPSKPTSELQYSKHCVNSDIHYNDHDHGINYDECNCDENIYDTIKPCDTISESNCYESIPGSPHSVIKMRQKNSNKYLPQLLIKSNIPFDSISNFSQSYSGSTISSENKTNSIYGQRSIVSSCSIRSEATIYGNAPSEISSSDRSDDWVDMSDQDETIVDPSDPSKIM